jgi:hypothetical protein
MTKDEARRIAANVVKLPGRCGPRSRNKIDLISIGNEPGWDGLLARLRECSCAQEEIMRRLAIPILVAAAAISCSAHDVVLAQATTSTQQVSPTLGGLSTPVTSTVTNCMMLCNSQVANCQAGCFVPAPPAPPSATGSTFPTPILNATVNPACTTGCTSVQLACQTNCARQASILGQ